MHRVADLDVTSEERNEKVRRLDPLGLDEDLRALPEMNEAADVDAMVRVLCGALPTEGEVAGFTVPECLAAMRDLGMYLGSLKRHVVSAFDVVPHAVEPFEQLGRRVDMIPRDTVFHYTCWNPVGERERLYTGHRMERSLVNAVRSCVPHLAHAVEIGHSLQDEDLTGPAFADKMTTLASCITVADKAMSNVMAEVAPEFFAHVLRPYFEDVDIAGRTYLGPAAAHIPLFLVDVLLWASDRGSPGYAEFCDEVAAHGLPHWRERYAEWVKAPSIASRVIEALGGDGPSAGTADVEAGARGLRQALKSLTSFRGKHLVMARRAYHEDVRLYELGSGGGSIGLLEEILKLTRQNGTMVNAVAGR